MWLPNWRQKVLSASGAAWESKVVALAGGGVGTTSRRRGRDTVCSHLDREERTVVLAPCQPHRAEGTRTEYPPHLVLVEQLGTFLHIGDALGDPRGLLVEPVCRQRREVCRARQGGRKRSRGEGEEEETKWEKGAMGE